MNDDGGTAGERCTPDVRSGLKSDQPLLPKSGAAIPANWRNRCRIVKACARRIAILDHDSRRSESRGRGDANHHQSKQGAREPEEKFVLHCAWLLAGTTRVGC